MTQYNSLNVKLSNSQLNKLKSAIKNESELVLRLSPNVKLSKSQLNKLKSAIKNKGELVLRLSPNMIGETNDKSNFPHKLLLTDTQVLNIRKTFSNNSSADIRFSKTQLSKMVQLGGFLVDYLVHC